MKIILVEVKEGVAKVGDIKAKDKTNHKMNLNKNKVITKDIIKAEVKEVGEGDNHKRDTTTPNIIRDKVNTTRVPNMVLPLHHLQHNHLPNMIQIGNWDKHSSMPNPSFDQGITGHHKTEDSLSTDLLIDSHNKPNMFANYVVIKAIMIISASLPLISWTVPEKLSKDLIICMKVLMTKIGLLKTTVNRTMINFFNKGGSWRRWSSC